MADILDYIIDFLPQDATTRALIRLLKRQSSGGGGGGFGGGGGGGGGSGLGAGRFSSIGRLSGTRGFTPLTPVVPFTDIPRPSQAPVTLTVGETGKAGRAGFEKPVGAAVRLRLDRLRRELIAASPKGKHRPLGYQVGKKFYTYRKPYIPGKLKASWENAATVQLSKSGKSILIRNDLPYARAQDKGADIPARYPKKIRGKNKFLMFPGGGKFFHKSAKAFRLRPYKGVGFVKPALENWRKKWGYEDNVRWAPYRGMRVEE